MNYIRDYLEDPYTPIPKLQPFAQISRAFGGLVCAGRHAVWNPDIHDVVGYQNVVYYGMRFADYDPTDNAPKTVKQDACSHCYHFHNGKFYATPEAEFGSDLLDQLRRCGKVPVCSLTFDHVMKKDCWSSHGGHPLARFCTDVTICETLTRICKNPNIRYVIDVGAKYGKTPSLLRLGNFTGNYLPVRPPGTAGSYDDVYHMKNEHLYRATGRQLPLQKVRIQDAAIPAECTAENTVMLINDAHYYLADYQLPFDAYVSGMTFAETEAFYTLPGLEGYYNVTTKDGVKWIDMFTFGNSQVYTHPLIRVTVEPSLLIQINTPGVIRYNAWFCRRATTPFRMVEGESNYRAVNMTTALLSCTPKARELPFTNRMNLIMLENGVVSGPFVASDSWSFTTGRCNVPEHVPNPLLTRQPNIILVLTRLVCLGILMSFVYFGHKRPVRRPLNLATRLLHLFLLSMTLLAWKRKSPPGLSMIRRKSLRTQIKTVISWFIYGLNAVTLICSVLAAGYSCFVVGQESLF